MLKTKTTVSLSWETLRHLNVVNLWEHFKLLTQRRVVFSLIYSILQFLVLIIQQILKTLALESALEIQTIMSEL